LEPYFELAYALESKSLCFFVGTGFSMHITAQKAPNWLDLLKKSVNEIEGGNKLLEQLFPDDKPIMPLEECASIIQVKMHSEGKCLHTELAKIIKKVKLSDKADKVKSFVNRFNDLKFITTNYDLLIENELLGLDKATSYAIGYPVNRQPIGVQVYHIHGSVKFPKNMVVTADDYFKFINKPDYFSKKVQTLIEENTTVIIGYSLADINFKSILNNLRANRAHDINRQHLFYLSRSPVDKHVKDYYDKSYGLRVIDNTNIDNFFATLLQKHKAIEDCVSDSKKLLISVLDGSEKYTDEYLKSYNSFFEIIATLSSNGILASHSKVIKFIKDILQRKNDFTSENGAWVQYDHLASWLIHLGSIMDMKNTLLEKTYLDAVKTSFGNMSKIKYYGCSWDAFQTWKTHWNDLTYENRVMIREFYKNESPSDDAKEVMTQ
jgi:hypothetical protein